MSERANRLKELCELVELVNATEPLSAGYSDAELKDLFSTPIKRNKEPTQEQIDKLMQCEYGI